MKKKLFQILLLFSVISVFAQDDDLLKLVEDTTLKKKSEKVYASFKTTKLVNAQTIETVAKNELDFRITHRFGNLATGGSAHTMWGFDEAQDIRYSFDYGLTNTLTLGFARSKDRELLEAYGKWRLLTQTTDNKVPVSVAMYSSMGITPMREESFYRGVDPAIERKFIHRISYFSQLVIARKISNWLSLELLPAYHHRNFVRAEKNAENDAEETNGLFSCGVGGRLKITRSIALIADYYYVFSKFRESNPLGYYNPLAVGIEVETGGHVFHINVCNNRAISENGLISQTMDTWTKGQYKLGFNISRVFSF
jgi:hypothetical protein